MGPVAGVIAVIAVLVALAATLAVYPPLWRAFRDQWRRIPPDRRRRSSTVAAMAVALSIAVGALLILQPWGSKTALWVALIGVAAVLLLSLGGVSVQAVIEVRRARSRR